MAIFTPGAIISEIRGSIANTTYSRSRAGAYSKAKLNQTNPDTTEQQAIRAITAAAVTAWQSLTDADRTLWNSFAKSQLSKPRIGGSHPISGYNAFIRFYTILHFYGGSGNPDPAAQEPIELFSNFGLTVTASAISMSIDGTNTDSEIFVVFRLSGPRSPGQSTVTPTLETVMNYQQAPNGSLSQDLTSTWVAKWGALSGSLNRKIFGRIDIVNRRTAQRTTVWRGSAITSLGQFIVAVASSGTGDRVMSSENATSWSLQSSAADNNWTSVTWSPDLGLWAAVAASGSGNRVMTSPDGINWTIRSSAADLSWTSICWASSAGVFIAVAASGSGNRVMTSPDGINWTIRSSAADLQWQFVIWAESLGLFVAVAGTGSGNRVMTSPDGINWTSRSSAVDNGWTSVAWSSSLGLLAAVSLSGSGNRVMTSPDGINWTSRSSAADNTWSSITWSAQLGLFIAVSTTGTGDRVMTSPDGINWTTQSSAADYTWAEVVAAI